MQDSTFTRRLGIRGRSGSRTTLVVPVPEAEEAVEPWRAAYDVWAGRGVPAHVTVQGPFLPPGRIDDDVLERLAALLRALDAQPFALTKLRSLPGVVFLEPALDEPFARITRLVTGEWRELPRYGAGMRSIGRYHLTVARTFSPHVARRVRRALLPRLPIEGRTEELLLLAIDAENRVERLARLPIGSSRESRSGAG